MKLEMMILAPGYAGLGSGGPRSPRSARGLARMGVWVRRGWWLVVRVNKGLVAGGEGK